jgi:aromatic-amino-acid transaminase
VLLDDDGTLCVLPSAARAVREVASEDWAAYAPISGTAEFRSAVIGDLLATAPELRAIAVSVATPGASGALRHAIVNFLEPGQAVLTTAWFWSPYATLCDEAERRLETFRMFDSSGGLDVAALDRAVSRQLERQGRALVILNDPAHNPTGYSMTSAEWRAVAECLAAHAGRAPLALLVDCAYRHYGPATASSSLSALLPLAKRAPVLFAWSASKSYTHYGLRVGALVACVADDDERRQVAAALSYSSRGTWSNCIHGGQQAITRLMVDPVLRASCSAEREALKGVLLSRVHAFNRQAAGRGLKYPRYDGGFFVTIFAAKAHEHAAAMRARGVYVVPMSGDDGGVLRVALCATPERHVAALVDALAAPH